MTFLNGDSGTVHVDHGPDGTHCVQLNLATQ